MSEGVHPEKCLEDHSKDSYDPTDKTDGREQYHWTSKYPKSARIQIGCEGIYLLAINMFALALIFLTWNGWLATFFAVAPEMKTSFNKFSYFASAGLLGGVVFGIKFYYRSAARGWWHQDRRPWRLMSPFLGLSTALVVGAMMDASLLSSAEMTTGTSCVSIGFLAGYFADKAIAKMSEVANVIFGKSGEVHVRDAQLSYRSASPGMLETFGSVLEASRKNNVSVRSVQLSIQLLANLNRDLIREAIRERDARLKRRLYITQAAYIYELADIVLDILQEVKLEGAHALKRIHGESEGRINHRIKAISRELERVEREAELGRITEQDRSELSRSYDRIITANETTLEAWTRLMGQVRDQEDWMNKMRGHSASIELKRNAAKLQLETLRDIAIVGEVIPLIDLTDLVSTIQDLPLLDLDESAVRVLLGEPVIISRENL